jgi:iron complex transport system permease protein
MHRPFFFSRRWRSALVVMLLGGLVAATLCNLMLGSQDIGLTDIWQAVWHYDSHQFSHRVIIDLRMLRLAAAWLVGGALGVAGLLLQSIVRNPLAEPHILGLNAGAALAVVITNALGIAAVSLPSMRPWLAAGGAVSLFTLVMAFSSAGRHGITILKLTLSGVALCAFASSLTATILILDEQTLLAMRTWLAGDLSGLSWVSLKAALLPIAGALLMACWLSPALNTLALGEGIARGLGVNLRRTRVLAIIAIALLSGGAVSIAGPVGFIGLLVPHLVRQLITRDMRLALPAAAGCGALLLLCADMLARTLLRPQELATGVVTALVGAPLFIVIALRSFK